MSADDEKQLPFEDVDFFDLLRRLEQAEPAKPRIGTSAAAFEDFVALQQEPHIDHSDRNVTHIAKTAEGRTVVRSRFLGLLGPQGALPLHTTYEAVHWETMRDPAFARFLDVFNHRFQQLFYRAWANARPVVQADRPKDNQFLTYIGSAIGIGTPSLQSRDTLHDHTKLALAGLLAPAVKSAARIETMLEWLFRANVTVQQCIGTWLPLETEDQASLAPGRCQIGIDSLIGKSAFGLSEKFRIRIEVRDLREFEMFLPDGAYFQPLADAVRFYLGNLYIYDVEIGLASSKTQSLQLGQFGRLGWTSWMKHQNDPGDADARWDCRFHPTEIASLSSSI